ncbi:ATP-grasp fold amidoligase family protein [Sphingomonas montana]|uniref:ATP-grasp fold amidoligase family protein n=1 Tax=Sphingomonas montana TaxID=1843236 RepID=UPI001F0AB79C|nr:ATP-grasp fold amidoligase family protein [Sphingomonas montana]
MIPTAPRRAGHRPTALPWLRVQLTYLYSHGRPARIAEPRLFTEYVQHRKLHDHDPRYPGLADKVTAKEHVATILGDDWIIPTLWHGTALPDRPDFPRPFVVKSRHGCNQRAFVRSPDVDWQALRRRADRWVSRRYGYWLDEWLYAHIPPGVLIEPFIGPDGALPIDYKLFVFGGRVAFVQVHLARETAHRWIVVDRDWRAAGGNGSRSGTVPGRPVSLPAMIDAAETLAKDFDFVRVDFYEVAGQPKFSEMTFYPGSGLYRLDPIALDREMGLLWASARDSGSR